MVGEGDSLHITRCNEGYQWPGGMQFEGRFTTREAAAHSRNISPCRGRVLYSAPNGLYNHTLGVLLCRLSF